MAEQKKLMSEERLRQLVAKEARDYMRRTTDDVSALTTHFAQARPGVGGMARLLRYNFSVVIQNDELARLWADANGCLEDGGVAGLRKCYKKCYDAHMREQPHKSTNPLDNATYLVEDQAMRSFLRELGGLLDNFTEGKV